MRTTIPRGAVFRAGGIWLVRAVPGLWPALVVVALLACVLVPLPTRVVDLLLSTSLAGSVLLVVASLRVDRTTDLLVFPSLLLGLTLFRLALNVSTTRLILSQADAGRVIDAFAGFVVRGDFVVGAVIFAIITLIQYLVVARGAERVAEVGARFALDALPGHQAAIDADLRAGAISPREAAGRRAALMERSRFHGAMDGAIRFVRGDVTAGLVITAVNLAGGLWIGTVRRGLSWADSLDLYGRLTIGDGLLAQIPAVLVSVAAGILVARIDREDGTRLPTLAWIDPAMLLVPAVFLVGLALVPAMPTLAFLSTACALGAGALWLARRRSESERSRPRPRPREVCVYVPPVLASDDDFVERIAALRGRIEADVGLPMPPIRVLEASSEAEVRVVASAAVLGRVSMDEVGADVVVVQVYRTLLRHADHLVDATTFAALQEDVRSMDPALAREATNLLTVADWVELLRAMSRDRVPLPPAAEVFAAVAFDPRLRTADGRAESLRHVRLRIAPSFVPALVESLERRGPVTYVRATPDLEADLLARYTNGPGHGVLRLATGAVRRLRAQVEEAAGDGGCVVLATAAARNAVALALFDRTARFVPVIAVEEFAEAGLPLPRDVVWLDVLGPV
ncbi:MAG: hypothetical protein D6705_11620 [Deltaproteobacteria bacterium]|nr:MAG: hypothetical protein D6705_11620 [Deltaproteobacteria bacterium]